jgi:hypothetical protein
MTRDVLVLYEDAPAALVGPTRFSFLGDVRRLPPGHPIVRMVTHMGYYAQLVLTGQLPGPYTNKDAERFARFALIDLDELVWRKNQTDDELAGLFRVPPQQVAEARQDLRESDVG